MVFQVTSTKKKSTSLVFFQISLAEICLESLFLYIPILFKSLYSYLLDVNFVWQASCICVLQMSDSLCDQMIDGQPVKYLAYVSKSQCVCICTYVCGFVCVSVCM